MKIFFEYGKLSSNVDSEIDFNKSHLEINDIDGDVTWHQFNTGSDEGEVFPLLEGGVILI